MSAIRNRVSLIGRLGKDPETKAFDNGRQKTSFSLATTEVYKKDGEKQEVTQWHNVVMWGSIAKTAAEYLSKGQEVALEGKLTYRNYDDKEGNTRYITEVVVNDMAMLGKKAS
ncbi:single-stranded DNA-binding protein [Sanyastnella coralliicola]|uniref:single-stranded DNA-binding protein n=1 Tax=Sanyastnella coralliicola TaxID=3069118 RepID=UPI0027B98244|nr:single-stranded DNA-binding protein [Longitalea sp. SCSIO 12813]